FVEGMLQLVEPGPGGPVGRGAPVAARAEAAAGRDLGRVGDAGPLELADLEEAVEEDLEPLANRRQIVGALEPLGIAGRPLARRRILPGLEGEEGDLRGRLARAQD